MHLSSSPAPSPMGSAPHLQHHFLPSASQMLCLMAALMPSPHPARSFVSRLYQGFTLSTAHLFSYQTCTKSPLTETYVCTSITPYLTDTIFSLNTGHMAQSLIVKVLQQHYLFSECVNTYIYIFSVCSSIHSTFVFELWLNTGSGSNNYSCI